MWGKTALPQLVLSFFCLLSAPVGAAPALHYHSVQPCLTRSLSSQVLRGGAASPSPALHQNSWGAPAQAGKAARQGENEQTVWGRPIRHCTVEFAVRATNTIPGESVAIVGEGPSLGAWKKPLVMTCIDTWPLWTTKAKIPEVGSTEYKYVRVDDKGEILEWEDGEGWREGNRCITLTEGSIREDLQIDDGQFGVESKPIYTVSVHVRVRVETV